MMHRRLATGRGLVALVLAALIGLAGCGIPAESEPYAVAPPTRPVSPSPTTPAPTQTPTGGQEVTLYLTRDGKLVAVPRTVEAPPAPTPESLLEALAAPLTTGEQQQGLGSALAGTDVVDSVQVSAGMATVVLSDGGLDVVAQLSQNLAIAQIVCTLTAREDITSVVFERAGNRVSVPRGDSSQSDEPLTAADYASLIEPP